jgi:acyl-CoA thioesterase YciA
MKKSTPAIRVIMMPRDTNAYGTIFGGVILGYLDQAGVIEALRHSRRRFVTVAMKEVHFVAPVHVGDVVSFYTRTVRVGRTSVTVRVDVEAQRRTDPGKVVRVTRADIVYVAIDDQGRAVPIRS